MRKITISENGTVTVPTNVQMRNFEIAELFGVLVPTVKGKIRQILKEDVCSRDFSTGGIVVGGEVLPEYYGLNMVVAVAFRVQSHEAKVFREWVMQTCIANNRQPIVLQYNYAQIHLSEQN